MLRDCIIDPASSFPDHPNDLAEGPTSSFWRRLLSPRTLFSFLIAAALLVALWRMVGLDWRGVWAEIQQADARLYLAALLVYYTTLIPRAVRWRRMLSNLGHRVKLRLLGEIIFLSWFINHLIPAKMGDLYRGLVLRRRENISFALSTGSVLAERAIDILALFTVATITALFFVRGKLLTEMQGVLLGATILVVIMVGGLFVLWRFDSSILARFPLSLGERLERLQRGIFTSVQPLWFMVPLTVLVWAAEAGRFLLVANALDVSLSLPQLLFVFAAGALLLAAPTPGGLGAVEGGMVGVMLLFDVPVETAAAVAFLDRSISYWLVLIPGAGYYFTHARLRL